MAEPATRRLSYSEYLDLERDTDMRHEFLDGAAWAMSSGTPRHSAIKSNLLGILFGALRGSPCRPYDSDLKVRVVDSGFATYPDLTIICGPLEPHAEDRNAATNPTVLIEVLSKHTEAWDRGGKFLEVRHIATLRHYLLVSQDTRRVEHLERQEAGAWRLTIHGPGELVTVDAIATEIAVNEIYERLPEP
ncbi:MAG: Uma2 family endonuclease [Candidatus Schekmanbacteria bacterium]|nr:Uma2 family endonuclease [Candidatus Schekmanbacteria bacterium]